MVFFSIILFRLVLPVASVWVIYKWMVGELEYQIAQWSASYIALIGGY